MANVSIIMGKSGTGKSTSIKSLNPKETVIINPLGKKLPFKGSSSLYSKENKNLFQVEDHLQIITLLESIGRNASYVKNIVLDDFTYVMRKEYFKKALESGYSKYTALAQHTQQIISACEGLREDLNVFIMYHSEDVVSDGTIVEYKVATIGKLLDSQYSPTEVVPMVLYSAVKFDDKGVPSYGFYTHRCMEGSTIIPAKSPADMFDEDFICNDLQYVVDKMNEYYA